MTSLSCYVDTSTDEARFRSKFLDGAQETIRIGPRLGPAGRDSERLLEKGGPRQSPKALLEKRQSAGRPRNTKKLISPGETAASRRWREGLDLSVPGKQTTERSTSVMFSKVLRLQDYLRVRKIT